MLAFGHMLNGTPINSCSGFIFLLLILNITVMKTNCLLIVLVALMVVACSDKSQVSPEKGEMVRLEAPAGAVRDYVETDAYLDFDVQALVYKAINPSSRSVEVTPDDVAKSKAAVYRFYKHVKVRDGLLRCSLKNGAEINVSDRVFKAFMDNIDELNEQMQALYDQGDSVDISDPTEEYLNSLLD